jgi:hypothetical protein
MLQIWQSLLGIAAQEGEFTPPSDVLRVVKSFALSAPELIPGVRLLFDSDLQPITAGIRGSVAARQFLYETDHYYIDFRLEPQGETGRVCVTGQVLSRSAGKSSPDGIAVRVQEGKQPFGQTNANQFGEFQLEFSATQDLRISISRNNEREVILPPLLIHAKSLETKDLD